MDYNKFRSLLPESSWENFDAIWQHTGGNSAQLQVCIAGAFSTGKTSLLNYLLGDAILPVDLEETTSLPTFIGYGETASFKLLIGTEIQDIAPEALASTIINPPAGATLLDVQLPQTWLRGVNILDLPGTGSVNAQRLQFATEHMREADAIIYLLACRGPSQADLEDLRRLHLLGKSVFLGISHWDEVEDAVKRGEPLPNVQQWAREIEYNCGLKVPLVPIDRYGKGSDAVLDFLLREVEGQGQLRLARFTAEAAPQLQNLIATAEQALQALGAQSEQEAAAVHSRLLAAKDALLTLRQNVRERLSQEKAGISKTWDDYAQSQQDDLSAELECEGNKVKNIADLAAFLEAGKQRLTRLQDEAAVYASRLSERYGRLGIDELPKFAEMQINIATPPPVSANDFLDMGRYTLLQHRLEDLENQAQQDSRADNEARIHQESMEALNREIARLESEQRHLQSLPVPLEEVILNDNNQGKMLGRAVGELADLALFFVTPVFAAGKVGSLVSKAGKAIGLSAKAARTAAKTAKIITKTAVAANRLGTGANTVPTLADKAQVLDKLTLGYWGERLGSALDGPQQVEYRPNPEVQARHDDAMRQINDAIRQKRLALLDLQYSKNQSSSSQDTAREMTLVRQELAELEQEARSRKEEAENDAQQDMQRRIRYEKERVSGEISRFFAIQLNAMRDLLMAMLNNWYENSLQELLAEKQDEVDKLLAAMHEVPERRQAREEELQAQLVLLREAVQRLP